MLIFRICLESFPCRETKLIISSNFPQNVVGTEQNKQTKNQPNQTKQSSLWIIIFLTCHILKIRKVTDLSNVKLVL